MFETKCYAYNKNMNRKRKRLLLAPIVVSLVSCIPSSEKNAFTLHAQYDYGQHLSMENPLGENVPQLSLLWGLGYLDSSFGIDFPDGAYAGMSLEMVLTKDGAITTQDTYPYPARHVLSSGRVLSYRFIEPPCQHIQPIWADPFTPKNWDAVLESLDISTDDIRYVVIDGGEGFIPLEQYEGDSLYLSQNLAFVNECPQSAWCEPSPWVAAAAFSYDPSL